MAFHLYFNDDFPMVATISSKDIAKNPGVKNGLPIIHAYLANTEIKMKPDGVKKKCIVVRFQVLQEMGNSNDLIKEMIHQLMKFVAEEFHNKLIFEWENFKETEADSIFYTYSKDLPINLLPSMLIEKIKS